MNRQRVAYYLDEKNRFIVEDYNWARSFSNFFPGIAGKWGIPMWIYYVSRAQAVCSVGIRDKDHQILEFLSFNKACQVVPGQGFRTFMKSKEGFLYEPFKRTRDASLRQRMIVSPGELEIHEIHKGLGLETTVIYYPLVDFPVPALIRELRVRNMGSRAIKMELVDGVSRILPYGMDQSHIKFTARHIEGMMGVSEMKGVPLFRLKQTAADVEQIGTLEGGNFYFSLSSEGVSPGSYIVDPYLIFGEWENYDYPWLFDEAKLGDLLSREQLRESRTPCAFTVLSLNILGRDEFRLTSLIGCAGDDKKLLHLLNSVKKEGFLERKREENRELLARIKNTALTVSSSRAFDQYCQQDFLDNVIRGGMPVLFETTRGKSALYLYSRQNGDLERDYHYFVLEPTYLSQGNGHYRSVYQNRRTDTWFFPEVEDANLLTFMNLLQLDGYNPLEVKCLTFTVDDLPGMKKWLGKLVSKKGLYNGLIEMVKRPFMPGEFIMKLEESMAVPRTKYEKIISGLLSFCSQNEVGGVHEGFWIDHWTYNLDLLDIFLMIYPDRLKRLLLGRPAYTFFDDPDIVLPRSEKYVEVDGRVRRYGAVVRDMEKAQRISCRSVRPNTVRTGYGKGKVYTTNLMVKLLCLVANRISTLDPEGIGIEMEADKPGWNDSMNGLPGLVASSLCETLELQRLCRFLSGSLRRMGLGRGYVIHLYEELSTFIQKLEKSLGKRLKSKSGKRSFLFWDESHMLLEAYREKTKFGVSGREKRMSVDEIGAFLDKCLELLDSVFADEFRKKIFHKNGVPYTYFINEVTQWKTIWKDKRKKIRALSHGGYPLVEPLGFKQRPVALFLEGAVHYVRVHPEEGRRIYESVRRSPIFDRELRMYKSCESLEKETFEIGRVKAYPRGWIENESVYLHMEYKYLLEILRSGLYEEFYRDMKNIMMPFLDPNVYGRSILEGASFIVSSAFPDKKLHGQAFQPRLSGITCEMLHIWILMVAGPRPFYLGENSGLRLRFCPALAGWLFTEHEMSFDYYEDGTGWTSVTLPPGSFAFKFIGRVLVVYHNRMRRDTFGKGAPKVRSYRLQYRSGAEKSVRGDTLGFPFAMDVRDGRVRRIDAILK